jgi:methyltransferase (TIGR00027 family)
MSNREASRTALATAYLRAAHQLLDAPPRILEDPVVVRLLGKDASRTIYKAVNRYRSPEAGALRSHVVLRSRFAEDRLAAAVPRGVTQYVILGAGFDTFALRQPKWAQSLKIVEVDHPGTQTVKRSFLAKAGLDMPSNTSFAHVDFERESLLDGLRRHHISLKEPTFFSWLGVTMYLNEEAIDAALHSMAAFPSGSEVVLTFLRPPDTRSRKAAEASFRLADRVASAGEPFVSHFKPKDISAKLVSAGFSKVEFLLPEMAGTRYFKPRPADLPMPRQTNIASGIREVVGRDPLEHPTATPLWNRFSALIRIFLYLTNTRPLRTCTSVSSHTSDTSVSSHYLNSCSFLRLATSRSET